MAYLNPDSWLSAFYLFPQYFPQDLRNFDHHHPPSSMALHRQLGSKSFYHPQQKLTISTSPTPATPSFFIENILNDRLKTVSPDSTSSHLKDVCNKTNGKQYQQQQNSYSQSLSLSKKELGLLSMVAQQERRGEKRNHSEMITGSGSTSYLADMDTFYHGPQGKRAKVQSKLTEDQRGARNNNNCHHHDSLGHHPLSKINGGITSCLFSPTNHHNTASSPSSSLSPSSSSSTSSSPSLHSSSVQGVLSSSSCEGEKGIKEEEEAEETMKSEHCLVNGRGSKSKRIRTIFKAEQLEKLELEFTHQQYMVGPERQALAASLDLTEAQVKVWFQNRRIKWRKQNEEDNKRRMVTFQPASSSTNGSETSLDIHDSQPHSANSSPLHQQLVFNFH